MFTTTAIINVCTQTFVSACMPDRHSSQQLQDFFAESAEGEFYGEEGNELTER
jgi:hypothetical protein